MASIFVRQAARAVKVASRPSAGVRAMAALPKVETGTIPGTEGLTGRARAEAVFEEAFGTGLFDRDATAFFEEGTRENPIPILSVEDERIVGISLPDDAEVRWFTMRAGFLAYDPDTSNFFALKKVTQAEVDEWIAKAEKQVIGK